VRRIVLLSSIACACGGAVGEGSDAGGDVAREETTIDAAADASADAPPDGPVCCHVGASSVACDPTQPWGCYHPMCSAPRSGPWACGATCTSGHCSAGELCSVAGVAEAGAVALCTP
jgi:hypothetical protein